jgi:RNA polymerase sigma-70 factor (ECF subfamily)
MVNLPDDKKAAKDSGRDSVLIRQMAEGNNGALEELYSLYSGRIYSMVYHQVGRDHGHAEEVVQETWLAVVKSAKSFKGKCQPYTWVCGIAWHKIRDFQRRRYRESAKLSRVSERDDMPDLELIDKSLLPQELIELEETKALVRAAFLAIPIEYRQVLTLKYLEELSTKEICEMLGQSIKAVERRLDRARKAMRLKLDEMSRG